MLCGKCKAPLLCKCCGETEYSDFVYDGHKFEPERCQNCKENPTYIKPDWKWYVKSTIEAIQILIFLACLIGFISSWVVLFWHKEVANYMLGWSVCVGLVNILFMVCADSRWRDDYIDRSMVRDIKEKGEGGHHKNR